MAKSDLYKKAGVDIDAATRALKAAKAAIKSTFNKNVATDIGSFGGVYRISKDKMLVSSTDGVGTKLAIAQEMGIHDTVGQDIVNHCVNDILVMGAKPLFFLDYFGTGKLEGSVLVKVISGMAKACRENNCVLIGGETAEMPGTYKPGDYDLVGTIVGEINNGRIITGEKVRPGDIVLGLPSVGLHTNGYSLARKVFKDRGVSYRKVFRELNGPLYRAMLKPHKSYLSSVYPLIGKFFPYVHGIAHLTGGGFYDNIIRVLPEKTRCIIKNGSWPVLPVFKLIQKTGNVGDEEMHRVFNMGIGMTLIVDRSKAGAVKEFLASRKERVYEIGKIEKAEKSVIIEGI
ncbi:MAG TPA: phosphoribosylformylglycinamidine cyclo-ligase [Candidatus Goldiibacteriota bacterium]|nr:phosphoribosylformylglycinamidine cyclo-ligase [Candidatus Goldiibacteriota bacterium]